MYEVSLIATNSADWAQAVELVDANAECPPEQVIPENARFDLAVEDKARYSLLRLSTDNGKITRPRPNVIQWRVPFSDLRRFRPGTTYRVGLTMTTANGTIQLFIGTLSFIDGIVEQ